MKNIKSYFKLLVCLCLLVSGCSKTEVLKLKDVKLTKELGEPVSIIPKDYLEDNTSTEILNKVVLSSPIFDDENFEIFDKTIVSKDKKYLEVGEYKFILTYDNFESKEITILIHDSIAPTFVDLKKEIEIKQNSKDVDFKSYFTCKDLSECKIEVDSKAVDLTKSGEYKIYVSAIDKYENIRKEEVIVRVIESDLTSKEKTPQVSKKGNYQNIGNSSSNKPTSSNNVNNNNTMTKEICESQGGTLKTQSNGNKYCEIKYENKWSSSWYERNEAKKVFNMINEERSKVGESKLDYADDLQWLADIRAQEVIEEYKNGNVHSGMYKHDPEFKLGEIVVVGTYDATKAMESWMGSKGHKDWILNDTNTAATCANYWDAKTQTGYSVVIFKYDKMHTYCHWTQKGEEICKDYREHTDKNGVVTYCEGNVCTPYMMICEPNGNCYYSNKNGTWRFFEGEYREVDYMVGSSDNDYKVIYYKDGKQEKVPIDFEF